MQQRLAQPETQKQIFNILFDQDDVTWQTIIYDLIAKEQMNPWDIDVSSLAVKFLETLKRMKEMNFRISGKIVLASAILLKIKSKKLVDEDIFALDQLIAGAEEDIDLLEDLGEDPANLDEAEDKPRLFPRTPQPRKRKVSVYDLVQALEKALEVEHRRKQQVDSYKPVVVPERKTDMHTVMKTVYAKVKTFFEKKPNMRLTFDQLIPSEERIDKVMTFIPLLHLDNQRKVDLLQQQHFGEIQVAMVKKQLKVAE